ncbi:uncharacterized protein HD556DRAFT_673280 [Suillus plorans]|uniref:Uncharacterized protein n=1 Tax=Suillus plorans TaxID=116603 RepID=A0A9P7DEI0_9AGAM|nr:uncharacterized protein HD556DRAFT_673280 [Suillus plorans]KAG1790953.1 hypothetical protein HD556DRAFT_673280 [Suillus plorans]
MTHLFFLSRVPPTILSTSPHQIDSSITFAALVLLQRLKAHFRTARGSLGHRFLCPLRSVLHQLERSPWSYAAVAATPEVNGVIHLLGSNQYNVTSQSLHMRRTIHNILNWQLDINVLHEYNVVNATSED